MNTEKNRNEGVADEASAAHSGSTLRSGPEDGTSPAIANAPAHTPGPWYTGDAAGGYKGIYSIGKTGGVVAVLGTNYHKSMHPKWAIQFGPEKIVDANARLIAAAPDLLAELQAIVAYVDAASDPIQLAANMVASSPRTKEIIRKATKP